MSSLILTTQSKSESFYWIFFKYVGFTYESTTVTYVDLSSSDSTERCNIAMSRTGHLICDNAIFQIKIDLMELTVHTSCEGL
jgi:hypothetical protein